MEENKKISLFGLGNLLAIYIIWGSTYLAIRIAVREGSGFPPFMLGATRTLVAGLILLFWSCCLNTRKVPTFQEWKILIVSGILLWIGGNGLVNWAEQQVDSGYTALLLGTMPLWIAIIEAMIDRKIPKFNLFLPLVIGFSGLVILLWPTLKQGTEAEISALIALLIAPLSWGLGSVILARNPLSLSPQAVSGLQQLIGCLVFLIISLLLKEPPLAPVKEAVWAWTYLVIAGGICAFTAYMYALKLLPTTLVSTYAYVNPVIAVFLGWLILNESITWWTIFGALFVLCGVFGVFQAKAKANRKDN